MKQRAKIVPMAEGVVLELGCGSGTNFDLYDIISQNIVCTIKDMCKINKISFNLISIYIFQSSVILGSGILLSY